MITVHFMPAGGGDPITVRCKPGKSLMQAAVEANVPGIDAECGGLLTCSTCHVFVLEPYAGALAQVGSDERGMLEFTASPARPNSRLSCQVVLGAEHDGLAVELPPTQI